jgi:hypothetical protein
MKEEKIIYAHAKQMDVSSHLFLSLVSVTRIVTHYIKYKQAKRDKSKLHN